MLKLWFGFKKHIATIVFALFTDSKVKLERTSGRRLFEIGAILRVMTLVSSCSTMHTDITKMLKTEWAYCLHLAGILLSLPCT